MIDDVFAQHRDKEEWELVAYTHTLSEWRDPKDSSLPIPYEDILRAGGASGEDIEAISENSAAGDYMDSVLAKVDE